MSPSYGYTAPAVDTIPEPRGEHALPADAPHVYPLDLPRDATRRFSSVSDNPARKQRTGSPQLHHFLKAGSPGATEASHTHAPASHQRPRPGLRRYSSADLVLLGRPKSGQDATSPLGSGRRASKQLQEIREHKRARLSPTSRSPWSASTALGMTRSGSSSESTSTVRELPTEGTGAEQQPPPTDGFVLSVNGTPADTSSEALSFLDGGSSMENGGQDTANVLAWRRNSAAESKSPSPKARSTSSGSSITSSPQSFASSEKTADTEVSFFDGHNIDGDETPIAPFPSVPWNGSWPTPTHEKRRSRGASVSNPDRYGTPEMPRGSAKLPHIPTSDLTPRVPNQGHPMHLPRAEKLPMSGYELLASSISATAPTPPSPAGNRMSAFLRAPSASRKRGSRRHSSASFFTAPAAAAAHAPVEAEVMIKPIYRKFEALNHRLLLHLQDELSELEEQLHRLDTTDTQTRRLQSSILPASRRTEFLAGGELQWHKTDILSKIGFKLGQYSRFCRRKTTGNNVANLNPPDHVLSSFTATRDLPAPSLADITSYRTYLATHQPISEVETRFLDPTDDLISLAAPPDGADDGHSAHSSDNGRARPRARPYLQSLRDINDDHEPPIVTPIPGTMHGNSWLVRHNRLSQSHGSGSSRGSASASGSPRFARPHHGLMPEPLPMPSPRLPASPLRAVHSVENGEGGEHTARRTSTSTRGSTRTSVPQETAASTHAIVHVAIAMAVAVLVPVLAFSVIPGFVGRMTVVLLMGLSVVGPVAQSGEGLKRNTGAGEGEGEGHRLDLMFSAAVYAGLMAVVAGIMA